MAYIYKNPNPVRIATNDCSVRALSIAIGVDWDTAYDMLAHNGRLMGVMPDDKNVLHSILRQHGFVKATIPDTCPDCYTASDFCYDMPNGVYVLGFSNHVATVVNGDLYDTWDSSKESPLYFWYKREVANNA